MPASWYKVLIPLGWCTRPVLYPGRYDVFMAREELDFKMRMMQGGEEEEVIRRRVLLTFIFKNLLKTSARMCRNVWACFCVCRSE